MAPFIRQRFGVQTERFSTDWGATYNDQANELIGDMAMTVGTSRPVYLIGHSNGGMVSRYVARKNTYNVQGLVTIGTPHWGAPAATYGASIANVIVGLGTQFHVCADATMCNIASELDKGWQTIARPARRAQPILYDMTPGTPVHGYLNVPEPFPHFGIQTSIWARHRPFALARDLGGSTSAFGGGFAGPCSDPESACGGRAFAQAVERAEARYRTCAVINNIWTVFKALQCQGYIAFIEGADSYHQRITSGSEIDQDGIVPLSSQLYPNTPTGDQYTIYQSVTHAGQTRSGAVRDAVNAIFLGRLGVTPR
jgi:pimeloyl-ACP methyl ester carboxylesterase